MNNAYDHVKRIIDMWDPIDLLKVDSPKDEYSAEAKIILNSILHEGNTNVLELANTISNVFIAAFGEDVFDKDIEACKQVAKNILRDS